jgi:hypothetical protein
MLNFIDSFLRQCEGHLQVLSQAGTSALRELYVSPINIDPDPALPISTPTSYAGIVEEVGEF